jgi:hypothetical protein
MTLRLLVTLLALSPVSAAGQQESLGDIAREEERRRHAIGERSKVYTNDDLPPAERPSDDGRAKTTSSQTLYPDGSQAGIDRGADSRPATAPATVRTTEPFCGPERTRMDISGNRFVLQTCADRSIRESGTTARGTIWQNTIMPDGSQYGSNNCGVEWKYDGRSTRYETSQGERGFGERIFRANMERVNRCTTASTLLPTYR